jgi:hypothetical protein
MVNRLLEQAMCLEPLRCLLMQGNNLSPGKLFFEPALQEFLEEVVVAVPLSLLVQGHDEQARILQPIDEA